MECIIKKFVVRPRKKQNDKELNEVQQSIEATQQQITAVENDHRDMQFTNEKNAIKLKRTQLQLLQKRKEAIESHDRVAGKKFRKINLNFLRKTTRQRIKGRRDGQQIEATVKVPAYSCHQLKYYSSEYSFQECQLGLELTGGRFTNFNVVNTAKAHPISKQYNSIYNTKAFPLNPIRYWIAYMKDREFDISLKDQFSGLIPIEVKKEIVEAYAMFDEVFLVKEANWQIEIIEKDPLIIGFLNNEAYLISHFDCTPFELYAKSEF